VKQTLKRKQKKPNQGLGGSCEIRTHGGLAPSPVFKTGAFNHSAKLPYYRKQTTQIMTNLMVVDF
jgi:hypothetical protein